MKDFYIQIFNIAELFSYYQMCDKLHKALDKPFDKSLEQFSQCLEKFTLLKTSSKPIELFLLNSLTSTLTKERSLLIESY
jgi:hypothetical protein